MGHFATSLKALPLGYPNPGWAPPMGSAGLRTDGQPMTYEAALGVGAFVAGIRLIAEDIASLPVLVYRRLPKGKERAPEHFAYPLLHDAPNPEMTAMVWRETGVGHLYSWGNWYAEKELTRDGAATARLWPLRPDRMAVEVDRETGRRVYKYRLPDGTGVILPANRVFHVPGFGFDGLVGYSRVRLMRRQIENAQAVEEYGLRTFTNGAMPGVVIRHPQQLNKQAKKNIVDSWDEQHAGLTNAQRSAILDEGMELETIGFQPEDAQFLESRRFSVEEMARGLRLAPHKLSDFSRATFSNIEESNIDHVVSSLGPTISRIDQQFNKDIVADPRFFAEHLVDGALRGRFKDRVDAEIQLRLNGLATGEELRAIENRNPLTDEDRQDLLVPLNSIPASAYDETGMNAMQRGALANLLARAGYDPEETLLRLNLPAIPHTGFLPTSVQPEPTMEPEAAKADPMEELLRSLIAGQTALTKSQGDIAAISQRPIEVKAGDVTVPPTVVNVTVPEQKASVIENHVHVPAAPAPVIENHVNVEPAPVVMPPAMAITSLPARRTKRVVTDRSVEGIEAVEDLETDA